METEKPEIILATQEDVDSFNSSLGKFSKTLGEKLKELEDQDGGELCLLKDEQKGIWIELHSKKIPADVLMCHAQKGFEFLESKRTNGNSKPLGI
ncbi:hypothetical protein COU58_04215 [Candidatus Pacearchaeota archaeon CG10_big_fil_rev_8_21_14_0_10_32_42]|nr:MAG: hypothetical protein COU58_04215 [Candidatus Pacearchaeota archaeon CG10_big_fil_rev_8_21_14_0_10_32_42]